MLGACLIGVGVWLKTHKQDTIVEVLGKVQLGVSNTEQDIDTAESTAYILQAAIYGIIGLGGFIFIISFCACCGAIKESKCLLGIVSLTIVLIRVVPLKVVQIVIGLKLAE